MFICNLSLHRNQRNFQDNLPMVTLNGCAQPSFSAGNETMNETLQREPSVQREGLYATLCPQSMMVIIHKMKRKLLTRIQILFSKNKQTKKINLKFSKPIKLSIS